MKLSGYGFIIGRKEGEGDFKDVRVRSTPEGLNYVEIARDPTITDPRTYVVDRRLVPSGAWTRVLEVQSFDKDTEPERSTETVVDAQWEDFVNVWGITPEHTFGIPAGMESPWYPALEMVGNELLLPEGAHWVSGDAPVNVFRENTYSNGKYVVTILPDGIDVSLLSGRNLTFIRTSVGDLNLAMSVEGTAGVITVEGGVLFIEPAKPPMFIGNFILPNQPDWVAPGLYHTANCHLICTHPIEQGRGGGALSIVADPYPERWVPRMMCRAFVALSSPSNVPPFIEDEPERISVEVVYPDNDFPNIAPEVTTPYANKTGVFNSWEAEGDEVVFNPSRRPWDVLFRFDGNSHDYGGHATRGRYRPADDRDGVAGAVWPSFEGWEVHNVIEMREGTLFFRFQDSAEFRVLKNPDMEIYYKRGYIYFTSYVNPESSGIGRIEVEEGYNDVKVDWTSNSLTINDKPGLTDEVTWEEIMVREDGTIRTWNDVLGGVMPGWERNPDLPDSIEQYQELPPTWETGLPEDEALIPDYGYWTAPRTWGRVLYEGFGEPIELLAGDNTVLISTIEHLRLEELL